MSKKIQLTIAEPCHENWEAMTDVQKGKFCGSCQKQVVDFTNMSDRQLAEFFKKPSTGSVCGRFMTDQLEREIDIPKKRIPWLKYFFTIAIPAFFASKATAQQPHKTMGKPAFKASPKDTVKTIAVPPVRMLGEVVPLEITPVVKGQTKVSTQCANDNNAKTITGIITNDKGDPIAAASIIVKGTTKGSVSDYKGEYKIAAKKGDALIISAIGYMSKEIPVTSNSDISVSLEIIKLDEVVVVGYQTVKGRVMMGAVSKVSRRTFFKEQEEPKKNTSLLTIYPNPATAGTGIHAELKKPAEGYYTYMLTSASGQTVHQQQIWIDKTAKVLSLDIPNVPAGTYILSLVNKVSGKKLTEKIVVQ